jgi:hypothetical protein
MKRFVAAVLLLLAGAALFAEDYLAPVPVPAIGFTAALRDGKVVCNWKRYLRGDLVFYKVVRSKTNPNPVYPDDGYIFYTDDPAVTTYSDGDFGAGVWYYSLTIVTAKGDRWTATPVKLTLEAPKSPVPTAADFR